MYSWLKKRLILFARSARSIIGERPWIDTFFKKNSPYWPACMKSLHSVVEGQLSEMYCSNAIMIPLWEIYLRTLSEMCGQKTQQVTHLFGESDLGNFTLPSEKVRKKIKAFSLSCLGISHCVPPWTCLVSMIEQTLVSLPFLLLLNLYYFSQSFRSSSNWISISTKTANLPH